jgi:hypothetical protein
MRAAGGARVSRKHANFCHYSVYLQYYNNFSSYTEPLREGVVSIQQMLATCEVGREFADGFPGMCKLLLPTA